MNYFECNYEVSSYFFPNALIATDNRDITKYMMRHEFVTQYSKDMKNIAHYLPITVFFDGSIYWLVDGLHGVYLKNALGETDILDEVFFRPKSYDLLYPTCSTTTIKQGGSSLIRHLMFEEILYAGNRDISLSQEQIVNRRRTRRCRNQPSSIIFS